MKIDKKVIEVIVEMLNDLLSENQEPLNSALRFDKDSGISISLPVRITPGSEGKIDVETGISFVLERVKYSTKNTIDPNQLQMFN